MIDDIRAARDAALAQIDSRRFARIGHRARYPAARQEGSARPAQDAARLRSPTIDEKKAAGQAVNEAMQAVTAALEARRAELGRGGARRPGARPSGST